MQSRYAYHIFTKTAWLQPYYRRRRETLTQLHAGYSFTNMHAYMRTDTLFAYEFISESRQIDL